MKKILKQIPFLWKTLIFCYNKFFIRFSETYKNNYRLYKNDFKKNDHASLKALGVKKIKKTMLERWKFDDGIDHSFRRYYLANFHKEKCFIKISNNDVTVLNEIMVFRSIPTDIFFSPKVLYSSKKFVGGFLIIEQKVRRASKFSFKTKQSFNRICHQFNIILDYFFKIGFVHGDIHQGNFLISKKKDLVLIDYGISRFCNSPNCIDYLARPGTFYKEYTKNGSIHRIYDDAFSFASEVERMNVPEEWKTSAEFKQIVDKISRNYFDVEVGKK